LGVVRIAADASFVMADIPGLIVGAAEGAGLGAQFLRHLSRTRILLHLVDVAPEDGHDPIDNALAIESELAEYSESLTERPIWLALSKVDQLAPAELEHLLEEFAEMFPDRPLYAISALGDIGLEGLIKDLMVFLTQEQERAREDEGHAQYLEDLETRIAADVWGHSQKVLLGRAGDADQLVREEEFDEEWDEDVDDGESTEVIYVRE
jgi:GTP-binding protein